MGETKGDRHMDVVLYDVRGGVATITLNRPAKLNALTQPVLDALERHFKVSAADDQVKVVVLTGAGRAFCAGFDLTEPLQHRPPPDRPVDRLISVYEEYRRDIEVQLQLWSHPKPTIAAVRGHCVAGGCEFAMACDMIIATEDAMFGEPEIRIGGAPTALLMPFVVGEKKANELLLTGSLIGAQEAHRLGMVNQVVPNDRLDAAVAEMAARIVPNDLHVLRFTKRALRRAQEARGVLSAVTGYYETGTLISLVKGPARTEYEAVWKEGGLRAALDWRDRRYHEALRGLTEEVGESPQE